MVPDQQRLSPDERSNLVAFIDGELPAEQSEALASKLTQSVTARREVDALRRTWELLDHLPRPQASDDFTARTLTQAEALGGRGGRIATRASLVARKVLIAAGWLVAAGALFTAGHVITARLWPNPSARLASDLPIAESLDAYREVGDIRFLRQLDAAPEFN